MYTEKEEPVEKRETDNIKKDKILKEPGKVESRSQGKERLMSERRHMYSFHTYISPPLLPAEEILAPSLEVMPIILRLISIMHFYY